MNGMFEVIRIQSIFTETLTVFQQFLGASNILINRKYLAIQFPTSLSALIPGSVNVWRGLKDEIWSSALVKVI